MKYGFDLLKTRPLSDNVNIASLEEKYNLKLPFIYKIFVQSFYLGDGKIFVDQYYSDIFKQDMPVCEYRHFNEEVGFYNFLGLEQAFGVYVSNGLGDQDYKNEYLPIGISNWGGLFIGMNPNNNYDKIILDTQNSIKYVVLADNIFEFLRGIEVKPIIAPISERYEIDYSKLYKNWGEDFWRLRED